MDSVADPSGVFLFRYEPVQIASSLRPGQPLPAGVGIQSSTG